MSIQVTVTKTGIRELQPWLRDKIRSFFLEVVKSTRENLRDNVPVDTGELRDSITVTMKGDLEADVGPTVPYAIYVDQGTRPHIIRPVNAKALRFEAAGEIVFTKLVHHPGIKPRHFMRETAEETGREVARKWRNQF